LTRTRAAALTGVCADCGSVELHAKRRCSPCYWRARRAAAKRRCPRCGQPGILRAEQGGICGWCVRRERPRVQPTPRTCRSCGRVALHDALGLCTACYQRDPARVATWTAGTLERLGATAPPWFADLAAELTDRSHPGSTLAHLRRVERVLAAGVSDPIAVVAALRTPGRSPGATAKLVAEFFTRDGLGPMPDEAARLAAARLDRRLQRLPARLRPAVEAFTRHLLGQRERAALLGRPGLTDTTIQARVADLAALAALLRSRGVTDWAGVTAADIEAFLVTNVGSRLASARAFFAFARRRRLILVDPTSPIGRRAPKGFAGRVLSGPEQRALLRRWTSPDIDPNERLVGLLCLLHGTSPAELRNLKADDINPDATQARLGQRAHPVPLDPLTADAVQACLAARERSKTRNPHLIVTRGTRLHEGPCSPPFMTHLLDPAGVTPRLLRQTRLADLAHRVDPRLVAAAFGMTEGGALHYVTDTVDNEAVAFNPDP
jgi:integrase